MAYRRKTNNTRYTKSRRPRLGFGSKKRYVKQKGSRRYKSYSKRKYR